MIYMIAGKARSGKNTLAGMIEEELEKRGRKVCNIELMRTLKGYAKDYFGWDGKDETKPRDLLQKFGTEIIREKMNKPLFHINRLLEDIEILANFFDDFIVDDVRFPLEFEKIKEKYPDSIAIHVIRDNYEHESMTDEQKRHITENALDGYDVYDKIIHNITLEKLNMDAISLVREVEDNEKND